MTNNTSLAGTAHVRALADLALTKREGVALTVKQKHEAVRLRQQFNSMRFYDREVSRRLYPKEHPDHGISAYDSLETKIVQENNDWKLIFRPVMATLSDFKITDLDTGESITKENL